MKSKETDSDREKGNNELEEMKQKMLKLANDINSNQGNQDQKSQNKVKGDKRVLEMMYNKVKDKYDLGEAQGPINQALGGDVEKFQSRANVDDMLSEKAKDKSGKGDFDSKKFDQKSDSKLATGMKDSGDKGAAMQSGKAGEGSLTGTASSDSSMSDSASGSGLSSMSDSGMDSSSDSGLSSMSDSYMDSMGDSDMDSDTSGSDAASSSDIAPVTDFNE